MRSILLNRLEFLFFAFPRNFFYSIDDYDVMCNKRFENFDWSVLVLVQGRVGLLVWLGAGVGQ